MTHFFVINLERSKDRWNSFCSSEAYSNELFSRIEATDGSLIDERDYVDFDIAKFRGSNGRHPRPGEYGCYVSHLDAIKQFLESEHTSGVILEDDTVVEQEHIKFCNDLEQTFTTEPMLIRLCTHRKHLFETFFESPTKYKIGQCWVGPTGSACAYWINRSAAEKLLTNMKPGYLPFDAMLENAWIHDVPTFMTYPDVIPRPQPPYSEIGQSNDERYEKFPAHRRLSTYGYRLKNHIFRLLHSIKTRKIPF